MEWMWGSRPRRFFLKRRPIRLSGSNRLNRKPRLRLGFPSTSALVFVLLGRLWLLRPCGTPGLILDHDVAGCCDDEPPGCRFRRPQDAQHPPVERLRHSLDTPPSVSPISAHSFKTSLKSGNRQRSIVEASPYRATRTLKEPSQAKTFSVHKRPARRRCKPGHGEN